MENEIIGEEGKEKAERRSIRVRVTEEDYTQICERMKSTNLKTMNAYMRKMALTGYIINVDMTPLLETMRNVKNISSNVNQMAVRVNSTNSIYAEDVEDLQKQYASLLESISGITSYIGKLAE